MRRRKLPKVNSDVYERVVKLHATRGLIASEIMAETGFPKKEVLSALRHYHQREGVTSLSLLGLKDALDENNDQTITEIARKYGITLQAILACAQVQGAKIYKGKKRGELPPHAITVAALSAVGWSREQIAALINLHPESIIHVKRAFRSVRYAAKQNAAAAEIRKKHHKVAAHAFGRFIQDCGFSTRRLAAASQIPFATIRDWCRGKRFPREHHIPILAQALRVSPDQIRALQDQSRLGQAYLQKISQPQAYPTATLAPTCQIASGNPTPSTVIANNPPSNP